MTEGTDRGAGSTPAADPSGGRPPVVYLLCGLPFAGKSTLARATAERLGLVHLEVDAINRERGLGGDGRALGRAEWAATYREAERRLGDLLAAGRSVVYDATNFRRLMRDRLRRVAAGHGAAAVVVLVEPGAAEVAARRARNRARPQRPDVPEASFAEVVAGFQAPGADEATVRYGGAETVDVWLGRLIRHPVDGPGVAGDRRGIAARGSSPDAQPDQPSTGG